VRVVAGGVRIDLRVIPRSPRTAVDGVRDGRFVLRVTAPPVDHAANEAVVAAIAEVLDVPKRAVKLVSGATSRNKSVEVEGVAAGTAAARLGAR
jgi:uncharacterized protein (TIGR00251 family)